MNIIESIKSLYLYHFLKNFPSRVYLIYKRDESYVKRGYHIWGGDKGIARCNYCWLKQLVLPADSYESHGGSFFFCIECGCCNDDPISYGSEIYNYSGKIIIIDGNIKKIKLDKDESICKKRYYKYKKISIKIKNINTEIIQYFELKK